VIGARRGAGVTRFLLALALAAAARALPAQDNDPAQPQPSAVASPAAEPSLDAIADFQIETAGEMLELPAAPESMASIVNPFSVRSRGRFYGSVYEYHRNDNFDARNFFDPVGKPLPEYKRNQFGASFGLSAAGRLNVFGAYDGLRINKGSTLISLVPTPEMKRGDFSALDKALTDPFTGLPFAGNLIPDSRIHPVTRRLLDRFPDPNRSDPTRNFVNNQPSVLNDNSVSARIDYEFDRSSKLFTRYAITDGSEARVNRLPSLGTSLARRMQTVSLSYDRTFSSNVVASAKLEFSRSAERELSEDAGHEGLLKSLGIAGLGDIDEDEEGYPEINITGYSDLAFLTGGSPRTSYRNDAILEGSLTAARGSHKLSVGGDLRTRQLNDNRSGGLRRGRFDFTGYFTGNGFADLLLGIPNTASRGIGGYRADLRQRRWRAFARDEWKISPRFTLSASLAYNHVPFYRSIHDNISLFWPLVFEPSAGGEIITIGSEQARQAGLSGLGKGQVVHTDRNDWEPQVGFAFSPFGNNRLVMRGTFYIAYEPIDLYRALSFVGRNYPFYYVERAESSIASPELDLSNPFAASAPAELTIRAINPYMRNAFNQNWELSVENQITSNWSAGVEYSGWRNVDSDGVLAANSPVPGPGPIQQRRPNPNFGRFDIFTDNSFFAGNFLNLSLKKKFSGSFSLQTDFSWGRIMTDNTLGWDPANPRDLRSERAPAPFRGPRRFSLNYIWDIPFGEGRAFSAGWAGKLSPLLEGWRLSGISVMMDGQPFSPVLPGDSNNDGVRGDRPDRIGAGSLPASSRSVDRWIASEDFVSPAAYAFGNSGRNILLAPAFRNWDMSLIRTVRLSGDGKQLEFRAQVFNAFNNVNFGSPNATVGTSLFGTILSAKDAREIEIALKYSF
jgi:hypothetical protein